MALCSHRKRIRQPQLTLKSKIPRSLSFYVRVGVEYIMLDSNRHRIVEAIVGTIEIPDSAYETAESRYKDIGNWFGRPDSHCGHFEPHIMPQGSFRLGTVNRPLDENAAYDLDLSCKLESGVTKGTFTQEQLKLMVGLDVESYRNARGIREPKEEKHRCWRLIYADQLSFHMDIVPCIPEEMIARRTIEEAMLKAGSDRMLARQVANLTVSITDNRQRNYRQISPAWKLSNPEGYARWFETRMKLAVELLEKRVAEARAAQIDDLPAFRWKTPLQRCVQLLKRHRDLMFRTNADIAPISIIITTLAARAYGGELDLEEAMEHILGQMGELVRPEAPRVPNPVNPAEDFADKWATEEGRKKRLEENFRAWLAQAQADFATITRSMDSTFISEQVFQKFGSRLNPGLLRERLVPSAPAVIVSPRTHVIQENPAKPWKR
jgi:hypothetical protein